MRGIFVYGGAHGVTTITIGTIDRKTGKTLKSDDVFPAKGREALEAYLRVLAIRVLGGEDHSQGEVKITDNFCLMGDGWHFIYNEYEIACYADGMPAFVVPYDKVKPFLCKDALQLLDAYLK